MQPFFGPPQGGTTGPSVIRGEAENRQPANGYFVHGRAGGPVYLCNPGAAALTDVGVENVGVTSNHPGVVHTGTARHALPEAPAGAGVLVDEYDVMSGGDFLTPYAITATRTDGTRLRATTIIDKGGPPGRFVPLTVTALLPAAKTVDHGGRPVWGRAETSRPRALRHLEAASSRGLV